MHFLSYFEVDQKKIRDPSLHVPSLPFYSLNDSMTEVVLGSCFGGVYADRLFVEGWLYKVTVWLDLTHPTIRNIIIMESEFKCFYNLEERVLPEVKFLSYLHIIWI